MEQTRQVGLSLIERIGYQVDEDWHKRMPELRRLAEDGDLEAEYPLAQRYEHCLGGVKMNTQTALDGYRDSATGGHPMDIKVLVKQYAEGLDGVERDPQAAEEWTRQAQAKIH